MKIKSFYLFATLLIGTTVFSQDKYSNANKIVDDVVITYNVTYDIQLSEKEKMSFKFKRLIAVSSTKNKLIEKTFTNRA